MDIPSVETVYPKILEANLAIEKRKEKADHKVEQFFSLVVLPEFRRLVSEEIRYKPAPSLDGKTSPIHSQSFELVTPSFLSSFGALPQFSEIRELFPYTKYSYPAPKIWVSGTSFLAMFFEDYPISKLFSPLTEELEDLGYDSVFIDFASPPNSKNDSFFDELSFRIRFDATLPEQKRKD